MNIKTVGKSVGNIAGWILGIFLTLGLIGVITGTIVGGAFLLYTKNYLDTSVDGFDVMIKDKNMTSIVSYVDSDGNIKELSESERLNADENRVWVKYADMNEYIEDAFVAIEDERFYSHKGVDWLRTIKCTCMFFLGHGTEGASTITQQVIKNVTGDDDVTIQRKAQEILKALNLEKKYDKTEILEMYLNNIYLSQGCYGVGAAAYTYFGKEVKDLTLIESAAIAGITQNPYYYDPIINPQNNAEKRNIVIQYMYDQGKISKEEYESAYEKELVLNIPKEESDGNIHSWYTDAAQQEAVSLLCKEFGYTSEFAQKVLLTGGYNIVTAQDPNIQAIVENYYVNGNWESHDDSPIQPNSSCVIIDHSNGNVVALVGSRGEKTINLGLNYATQTKRPPGSSIKPISVYAPALEAGVITYGSVLDDVPINYGTERVDSSTGKITYSNTHGYPKNSPDRYRGLTTVNEAVRVSINTISWRTLELLGLQNSYEFLSEKVGISTLVKNATYSNGTSYSDIYFAPLSMGQLTWGATVKEMTSAYQIFANEGVFNEERIVLKILDSNGDIIVDNQKNSTIAISSENATIMTKMLENVVDSGTGSKITLKKYVDCAGKTGTTENNCDKWFVGYTPYYVCGIWFGYENPRSLSKFSSTSTAPIIAWDTIMTEIHQKYIDASKNGGEKLKSFNFSDGVIKAKYCKYSGKLMTDACKAFAGGKCEETGYFKLGTEPVEYCDRHILVDYDKSTKAIAAPGCSSENIIQVGLIDYSRDLPCNIKVEDSQYLYKALPEDYSYDGLTTSMPYYSNILAEGLYSGWKSSSCFNHICTDHILPFDVPDEPDISYPVLPDVSEENE